MTDVVTDYNGRWSRERLPPNIRVGEGCFLEHVRSFGRVESLRDPALVIGDRVTVNNWSNFYLGPDAEMEIGDDSVIVGAEIMCEERVTIGRGVVISYQVIIADTDFHPIDPHARRLDAEACAPGGDLSRRPTFPSRPVVIDDGVQIAIGAMVLKGVRIGAGALVGPGAIVTRDVPPGATVMGNPAAVVTA